MRRGAVAVCAVVLVLAALAGCGGTTGPSTQATPSAAQTLSQRQAAARYEAAINPHLRAMRDAFTSFGPTCDPSHVATCEHGLKRIHDANAGLATALRNHPPPPCLQGADTQMHQAAGLLDQAMHTGTAALEQHDSGKMTQMMQLVRQAGAHMARAGDLMAHNRC